MNKDNGMETYPRMEEPQFPSLREIGAKKTVTLVWIFPNRITFMG
jgi:hypothetical protein